MCVLEDEEFTYWYRRLARLGRCDAPGSVEYFRVHAVWVSAGRPNPINEFICTHANHPCGTDQFPTTAPRPS